MIDRQIDRIWRYTNYYELAESDCVSLGDMMREIRGSAGRLCLLPKRQTCRRLR